MSVISKSGRGFNQLGLYDECNSDPTLEYILLVVRSKESDYGYLSIGICIPKQWNQIEYRYTII